MFRFTIRDLLLVTVLAALAVGWTLDHVVQRIKINSLTESVRKVYVVTREERAEASRIMAPMRRLEYLEEENQALRSELKLIKKAYLGQE